jgi:hypothetical protein
MKNVCSWYIHTTNIWWSIPQKRILIQCAIILLPSIVGFKMFMHSTVHKFNQVLPIDSVIPSIQTSAIVGNKPAIISLKELTFKALAKYRTVSSYSRYSCHSQVQNCITIKKQGHVQDEVYLEWQDTSMEAPSYQANETNRFSAIGNPTLSTSVVVLGGLPHAIPCLSNTKIKTRKKTKEYNIYLLH